MKKGDWIMMFFTVNIIFISWYSIIAGKTMDGSIAICYTAAIGVFVGRKGVDDYIKFKGTKVTKNMEDGDV